MLEKVNRLLSISITQTGQKTTSRTILLGRGNMFTELLPCNDGDTHIQTHRLMKEIYVVPVGMGSGAMI
jgi:hypothetical protein